MALSLDEERAFQELAGTLVRQGRRRARNLLLLSIVVFLGGCALLLAAVDLSSRAPFSGSLVLITLAGNLMMLSGAIMSFCVAAGARQKWPPPATPRGS